MDKVNAWKMQKDIPNFVNFGDRFQQVKKGEILERLKETVQRSVYVKPEFREDLISMIDRYQKEWLIRIFVTQIDFQEFNRDAALDYVIRSVLEDWNDAVESSEVYLQYQQFCINQQINNVLTRVDFEKSKTVQPSARFAPKRSVTTGTEDRYDLRDCPKEAFLEIRQRGLEVDQIGYHYGEYIQTGRQRKIMIRGFNERCMLVVRPNSGRTRQTFNLHPKSFKNVSGSAGSGQKG